MASGSSSNMELMTNSQDPNIIFEEVSPTTLLDSNRFTCDVCLQGFPRKQNLSLHQRVHNLPFTLKTRAPNDPVPKKKYLCPEPTCVHHNRSHAIGDFGGLKKHYLRKHSTHKNYKCVTCSKAYSVHADLKAHVRICAGKNNLRHSGSPFSRAGYFNAHPENCDAAENVGAGRTVSCPQTNTNESSSSRSSLIGPQISFIQNQSSSNPLTTPFQSQSCQFGAGPSSFMTYPSPFISPTPSNQYQLGYYADKPMDKIPLHNVNHENLNIQGDCGNAFGTTEGRNTFFDGGFMHNPSVYCNLTPAMDNPDLLEMLNPVTGGSDAGGYQQGGYEGYGVGSGPFEYSGGMDMFSYQQQQQHNVNFDPSSSFNLTPAWHNLGQNEMFNPTTGSSGIGGYEHGVGGSTFDPSNSFTENIGYSAGMETFNFQQYQQLQQPLQNVNPEYMNVRGGLDNFNGTGEGNSDAGYYDQRSYKGNMP
ncbi:putative transcription factor C2H2 family [Helianthus annuus]|nr:putative transcription factor C2H2 family [Helianthus annuus]